MRHEECSHLSFPNTYVLGDLGFLSPGISWDTKKVATLKALEYAFLPVDRGGKNIIAVM